MTQLNQQQITERLSRDLNIQHLSPQEQKEIITQMSTVLLDRITIALIAELPQTEMSRIDMLLEHDQTEAVQALLAKNIPNSNEVAEEVINTTLKEFEELVNNKSLDE